MSSKKTLSVIVLSTVLFLHAQPARAQEPKFEYAKPEETKGVEWKATAQAGLVLTTGNSKTTTFSGEAKASRKSGANKFLLEAGGAFARSGVFVVTDANNNTVVDPGELQRVSTTSAKAWRVRGRYDRFLTGKNSLYVAALVSGDEPAGKDFVGGGQAGYSRQLYTRGKTEVVAEAGYDFSFEDLSVGDSVSIHSLRAFLGYSAALGTDTGVDASIEFLANMNTLEPVAGSVGGFEDRRTTAKVAVTTKLFGDVNFRFGVTAKHDSAPAPRPAFGLPYAAGFVPLADKLDTKTEISLLINFI